MSDEEERYDEEELARARALAELLDRPPSAADDQQLSEELAAAETLRAAAFDAARQDAVFERAKARVRARRLRWMGGGAAVLSAAAAAVLWLLSMRPEPAPTVSAPPVSASVREARTLPLAAAQLAWLDSDTPETRVALDHQLANHRAQFLNDLQRRYAP